MMPPNMKRILFRSDFDADAELKLCNLVSQMFGKPAALYFPSATMANVAAIIAHCPSRSDAAILGDMSFLANCNSLAGFGIVPVTVENLPNGELDTERVLDEC